MNKLFVVCICIAMMASSINCDGLTDFSKKIDFDLTGMEEMMKGPGLELLDGLAHGLSPNTYKDTKSCYKDLSKDTWMKIVDAKNRLKLPEMKDKAIAIFDLGKIFWDAFKHCKSAAKDVAALFKNIGKLSSGVFLVTNAVKAISNTKALTKAYDNIFAGLMKKNYFNTGDGCGHIVGVITGIRSA